MNAMRHYKRYDVTGRGFITAGAPSKAYPVTVLDISASGLRIETEADLDVGTLAGLEFVLEGPATHYQKSVSGKVVSKVKHSKHYQYGILFVNFSTQNRVELDECLRLSYGGGSLHPIAGHSEEYELLSK